MKQELFIMICNLKSVIDSEYDFGNKANNLSVLINASFNVPSGICLSSDIYKEYCSDSVNNKNFVFDKSITNYLNTVLYEEEKYAVRSSSNIEDSNNRSYAGHFMTCLNTPRKDVLDSIKKIYDSGRNLNNDLNLSNSFFMGIIIQKMLIPTYSGVIFSYDFINKTNDNYVLELCEGLCEKIVGGNINPSLYMINKSNSKIKHYEKKDSGIVLSEKLLSDLSSLVIDAESLFGCHQNIEFSVIDEKIHILQSRPIIINN